MTVREYILMFLKVSKYSSSLMVNSSVEMSRFVIGVSEDLEEECREAMLQSNMDLCRLFVHAQQVEETHCRKRS